MSREYTFFIENDNFTIEGEEFYHLSKVLRLKEGENIRLLNGKGDVFFGKILKVEKRKALVSVERKEVYKRKSPYINVFISLVSQEKRGMIVQKLTEMGIHSIFFFPSSFSKVSLSGGKKRKEEKLRKIAVGALKQSGNPFLPYIRILDKFEELLDFAGKRILLSQDGDFLIKLDMAAEREKNINLIVGPEGGFSPEEKNFFKSNGFSEMKISRNVLRTETAAISGAAIISYILEVRCF